MLETVGVPLSSLLCIDDLPVPPSSLVEQGVYLALVDHNRVVSTWLPPSVDAPSDLVNAVIDHHADEGLYPLAELRVVTLLAGSCSSLVAGYFEQTLSGTPFGLGGQPLIPEGLATLLLSAVLIDTAGLKENGKATEKDWQAVKFLYPFSHLNPQDLLQTGHNLSITELDGASTADQEGSAKLLPDLRTWASLLSSTKRNVGSLSSEALLARDYKQFTFQHRSSSTLTLGLASVPLGLENWLTRRSPSTPWPSFLQSLREFADEHKLDVLGVMTSFKSAKGKHKRELLMFVPAGWEDVWGELVDGLEKESALDLKGWKETEAVGLDRAGAWGPGGKGCVWKQANAEASRKTVAPVLKAILEG